MSGILGFAFADRSRQPSAEQLAQMSKAMPIQGGAEDAIRLPGCALASLGFPGYLSGAARRPVQGGEIALALHGSIHNLQELGPAGKPGTGAAAAQALLETYSREGLKLLDRLRGEFVLAIWDGPKGTLHLATDPFRIFPLFYYQDGEKIIFASSIQAIRAFSKDLRLTIQPEAVVDTIAHSSIPTPRTIFKEIRKIPAGSVVEYRGGAVQVSSYWEINFLTPDASSQGELIRKLKKSFSEAIAVRLQGNGPVEDAGTFLSGGVDSSTVAGLVSEILQKPIKTFSIGFDESQFNEMEYARIAARKFAARHIEYFVKPQDVVDHIPRLMAAYGEPFANASAIPTYYCAKVAKENGINVLFAGDGGDELFGGNQRYATQRIFDYYTQIPAFIRRPFLKPAVFSMARLLNWKLFVKARKYILRASIPYPDRLTSWGLFEIIPAADLFDGDFWKTVDAGYDPSAELKHYYFQAPARKELDRQLFIDLKLAITDNDLLKVTTMSHAAGVAVRFPFLDRKFAEFAATVPAGIKMRGTRLRSFFKKAYADLLPPEVLTKKKHGFGLPIPIWLRNYKPLNEMMLDTVLSRRSLERGYFKPETLSRIVDQHRTDATSFFGTILWNVMVLELWHRTHQDGR